jgi:hypothetical protein
MGSLSHQGLLWLCAGDREIMRLRHDNSESFIFRGKPSWFGQALKPVNFSLCRPQRRHPAWMTFGDRLRKDRALGGYWLRPARP